jgi:hypothetical protein
LTCVAFLFLKTWFLGSVPKSLLHKCKIKIMILQKTTKNSFPSELQGASKNWQKPVLK